MDQLVIHCEQLWGSHIQWLNIITNIIFFLFALLFFSHTKTHKDIEGNDRVMIFSLIFLGIASFFWHTFPAVWSNYLDIGSIIVFSSIVITLVANKITKNLGTKIIVISIIVSIGVYLKELPEFSNSLAYFYLAFLIFIMAFGLNVVNKNKSRVYFRRAFILFIFGFIAHQLDLMVCDFLVTGSHFIWHIFAGWMGYYFAKGIHVLYGGE